jgi:hypothetical protein
LVHLSYNDAPMEIKQSELLAIKNHQLISVLSVTNDPASETTATPVLNSLNSLVISSNMNDSDMTQTYKAAQSDSIVYTMLGLLSKRDLINEQSGKYLVQYFQFFSYYSSLGLQQVILRQIQNQK